MFITTVLIATVAQSSAAAPPETVREPVTETIHGHEMTDPYRWLEALEADSERVREWTTAQNEYTRSILDNLPCRDQLEQRLGELMTIGSVSAPTMRENLYFYTEREGEQNQPVLYVREGYDGEPQTLLDPNELDEEGLYSLDWYRPNGDGSLLAFGLSYAGDEMTVLHLMDVETGEWLSDEIEGKVGFYGWSPDSSGFLYSRLSDPQDAYSRTIRYHTVGLHHSQDPVLIEQSAPSEIPYAFLDRDGHWIIYGVFKGWSKSDVYVINADHWRRTGEFEPRPIAVDLDARFSPQFIHGDTLFMTTTLDAPNGRAVAVDLHNPARQNWRKLIREKDKAVLQGLSELPGRFIASYERDATDRFVLYTNDGEVLREIDLPGLGSASIATEPDRTEAFLTYTSYNEPRSIYRIDLEAGNRELWARPEVPVDPSTVTVKQEWATSKDGTKIPMFIVGRKGLELDGDNPTLLYGYGGFSISLTPRFTATAFPWFEAGGVYVVANLRGGGEYGEAWHKAGMLANKQNVFDDLYACAEYLIEAGYTKPDRLAVRGGSNGGLLTGVAVTQRPELFAAAISAVPLLDMLRFDQFLMAKFWTPEYGSPNDPEQFEWLYAYSPYHNIKEDQQYPAILFTAGENDNRVHPLHARKMAAAMQSEAANEFEKNPIMLWVDRSAGHGSGKPLELRIRDVADTWSFLMWQTGLCE